MCKSVTKIILYILIIILTSGPSQKYTYILGHLTDSSWGTYMYMWRWEGKGETEREEKRDGSKERGMREGREREEQREMIQMYNTCS